MIGISVSKAKSRKPVEIGTTNLVSIARSEFDGCAATAIDYGCDRSSITIQRDGEFAAGDIRHISLAHHCGEALCMVVCVGERRIMLGF